VGLLYSYTSAAWLAVETNEGVAISSLVFTFYTFVNIPLCLCHPDHTCCYPSLQTVNTGSLRWGTINLMAYFYMVLSWGGYSFVINLIPIYCLACVVTGRLTARHYLAFAPLVFVGTLLAGEGWLQCMLHASL
jgi:dolichyl-diphosphooligosaccharide--protein glycosyltransferase